MAKEDCDNVTSLRRRIMLMYYDTTSHTESIESGLWPVENARAHAPNKTELCLMPPNELSKIALRVSHISVMG